MNNEKLNELAFTKARFIATQIEIGLLDLVPIWFIESSDIKGKKLTSLTMKDIYNVVVNDSPDESQVKVIKSIGAQTNARKLLEVVSHLLT